MRRFSALLVLVLLASCSAGRPRVKVLGVGEAHQADAPRELLVFLEVVNSTQRDLELSRLDYHLQAEPWFQSSGNVRLGRTLAAGSSATVEIPVTVRDAASLGSAVASSKAGGVPFQLHGTLVVRDGRIERAWQVKTTGSFARTGAGTPIAGY